MMPPEERVAKLEAFRVAHDERHNSFEDMLNLRFDDLRERLGSIERKIHTHNPGNGKNGSKNGSVSREIIVKFAFPSAGIGAGIASLLYWLAQVFGG